jgi:hypothetical protein
VNFHRYGTWNELVSVVRDLFEDRRACVLELVNGRLTMDYTTRCRCGVQANR